MKNKEERNVHAAASKNMSKVVTTVIMGALSIVFLVPLIWMISAAFKYEKDVMRFPIQWIPEKVNLAYNFKMVWMGRVPSMISISILLK